jgi:beta-ribofuranosylaminobenzene 5'-phosphate synthase
MAHSGENDQAMTEVAITTGSRLHFGPLSVASPVGGKFGGVGVMIDSPRIRLSARSADVDSVVGDTESSRRITEFLRRVREADVARQVAGCEVTVLEAIPSHRGFGSGTQLGLAIARASAAVSHEPRPSLETLARRVHRGLRSAIGLYGFDRGGFLVDGGKVDSSRLGTLVTRIDFPSDWRFVLASPRLATGLSGEAEQSAFVRQPPMPALLTGDLCRIVLMDWLPSVIEADFERCSESLFTFGYAVGGFFSQTQGGVFAHPRMAEWARVIGRRGVRGVAQTSWGPTLAALCPGDASAQQCRRDFAGDPDWNDCLFEVVAPLNRGATVDISL